MTVTSELRAVLDALDQRRHLIEEAIAKGPPTHTYDDFCVMVMQQRVRFWPLPKSFMATEVVVYPQCKHYHVWLAGGDLLEIKAQHDNLVDAAREAGCAKVTLAGRLGWTIALQDLGWKPAKIASVYFSIDDATELDLFDDSEAA